MRERGAVAEEVGPHRQDDGHLAPQDGGGVEQAGDERRAELLEPLPGLVILRAVGEDLLELVDDEQQSRVVRFAAQGHTGEEVERLFLGLEPGDQVQGPAQVGRGAFGRGPRDELGGEVAERVVSRPHDDDGPALAPLDGPPLQPGQQPREDDRRLAAARRTQHGEEPDTLRRPHLAPQAAHEPVGEVVPAEEELGVVRPERLQSAIRPMPLPPFRVLGEERRA